MEQEKREQARNIGSGQVNDMNNPQNQQQGILSDQVRTTISIIKHFLNQNFFLNRIMKN